MSRTSRWDRAPTPMDTRWFLRLVGKILIGSGLLMFGFVAYQLWGTGIEYARAQDRAENQFEAMMAAVSTNVTTTSTRATTLPPATAPDSTLTGSTSPTPSTSAPTSAPTAAPTSITPATPATPSYAETIAAMDITEGNAFGFLEVPSLGLGVYIFPGVSRADLENGPGHFPDTPMPGQLGNSAIAGHRTTYGQPFRNVDQIEPGDEIVLTMPYGRFVYRMTSSEIVDPSDTQVIATIDPTIAMLTLTSCHPAYSASQRYIVYAELDVSQSPPPGQPIYNYGRDQPAPTSVGLPGEDADPTSAPTTVAASTSTDHSLQTAGTAPLEGGATIETPTTTATPTTGAQPTTTATPDTLYNVIPGGGFDGGGGATEDDGDAFSNRWFSEKDALPQVALWALCCAVVVVGAYQLAKRLRNSWIGLAAGIVPFVIGLYFFYENVNRLLPSAL